jgi:hypothetical protein
MRLHDLFEAPIEDLQQVGDWSKNSSFRDTDRRLLNNEKAIRKITAMWEKTPVFFSIYLVNNPEGRLHQEVGSVSDEWLEKNMPRTFPYLEKRKSDNVTILFTNNSGAEGVPMTGWIMAHRFGHAIRMMAAREKYDWTEATQYLYSAMGRILDNYGVRNAERFNERNYDQDLEREFKHFFHVIGTFRSAREKKLRTVHEFIYEIFAQYLTTGKIRFNSLPKSYTSGRYQRVWQGTDHDLQYYENGLEEIAESVQSHFENMLYKCVGKTFVM